MFVIFQYALENEELTQHLGAAKDAQRALTAEVTYTHTFKRTTSLPAYSQTVIQLKWHHLTINNKKVESILNWIHDI